MKILLEQLAESPERYRFEGSAAWWSARASAGGEAPYVLLRPLGFEVEVRRNGQEILLEGALRGEIEVECSRCLVRYGQALSDEFRLVLESSGDRLPADPENAEALERDGVCLGDDLEVGSYRGTELDLEAYLAERVALAWPVQPVCRESCGGLCPHCGIDRNQNQCRCGEKRVEGPFAALASLKAEKAEGNS